MAACNIVCGKVGWSGGWWGLLVGWVGGVVVVLLLLSSELLLRALLGLRAWRRGGSTVASRAVARAPFAPQQCSDRRPPRAASSHKIKPKRHFDRFRTDGAVGRIGSRPRLSRQLLFFFVHDDRNPPKAAQHRPRTLSDRACSPPALFWISPRALWRREEGRGSGGLRREHSKKLLPTVQCVCVCRQVDCVRCCPRRPSPALVAAHADAQRDHLDVLMHPVLLLHGHGPVPGDGSHGEWVPRFLHNKAPQNQKATLPFGARSTSRAC